MTRPPTTRPTDGPADNDVPRAPESAGAWDIRSEALLADPTPKRPTGVRGQRLPAPRVNSTPAGGRFGGRGECNGRGGHDGRGERNGSGGHRTYGGRRR